MSDAKKEGIKLQKRGVMVEHTFDTQSCRDTQLPFRAFSEFQIKQENTQ